MDTTQRIAKNLLVLSLAQIASMGLSFYFTMYMARSLGAESFGIITFALAFNGIMGVFADLGLNTLAIREIARSKVMLNKYVGNILYIKLFLSVITFGLIAFTINLFGYPDQTITTVYYIAFSIIITSISGLFYSIVQAFEDMKYLSIGTVLQTVLMLIGTLIAINRSFNVIGFASIYLLSSVLVFIYIYSICSKKFVKPKLEIDLVFWKVLIKETLPFGISIIFMTTYYYIGVIMLSLMIHDNNESIGWFNAAYRLVVTLLPIPGIFFSAIFPKMSCLFKTSDEALKFVFERSLKYMMLIAIPIGVGITLLAERIILNIFGSDYLPSVVALQILVWASVLIFLSQPFERLAYAINKQVLETKISGIGSIFSIILCFLLIPKLGYIGVSFARVATELLVLLAYIYTISDMKFGMQSKSFFYIFLKISLSTLVMVYFITYSQIYNIFLLILGSIVLYFVSFYFIKGFDKTDILLIKKIINHEKGVYSEEAKNIYTLK